MRHALPALVLLMLLAVLSPTAIGQQPRGAAVIAGRVTAADSGAPVRLAEVQALNEGVAVFATTDEDGRFELRDLPAGSWDVSASRSGFVTWRVGQRRAFEQPDRIVVTGRERVTADIAMPRGGVIFGRVFDEFGEPAPAVRVSAYRSRMADGRRRLEPIAGDQTDDTGAYRIYGLAPGDYLVGASLRVAPADSFVELTYAPTFFPGTGNAADAQRIPIGPGIETNADLHLLPVRSVRVSGVVLDSSGAPASAFLNLMPDSAGFGVHLGAGGATRADGTFILPDVDAGRYSLQATLRNGSSETALIPVTVGSADVTGITVVTSRPARLRVTVALDQGVRGPAPAGIRITARADRVPGWVPVDGEGSSFEVTEIVEPVRLGVEGLPDGWAIRAIDIAGVDVTDTWIDPATARAGTARVVITDRVTNVSGLVATAGAVADQSVVVFPEDPAQRGYPSRFVRVARTDEKGQFQIKGLPPGERYLAVAVDYLEPGEAGDPEFLGRMQAQAVTFSFAADGSASVNPVLIRR